jgi:putative membrane protein
MQRNDKAAAVTIWSLSIFVFIAVVILGMLPAYPETPGFVYKLPALNASLNTCCTILLVVAFIAIRRGNIKLHKALNLATFALSTVFLVSYVIFHALVEPTTYPAGEPWRAAYYVILISHILLAAAVMPMVLYTFYWALAGEFARHRKLAKITLPVWLYVTTTGVIVYLMISPYYAF